MRAPNWIKTSLLFALTTLACGCAGGSNVRKPPECPVPQPVPPEVMQPRKPDFYERMRNFCCESDGKPMMSSDN